MSELAEKKQITVDNKPAKKCPDYDDECVQVVDKTQCWLGAWGVGIADGYCPLMYNK